MFIIVISVHTVIIASSHLMGVKCGMRETPNWATVAWQTTVIYLLTSFSNYTVEFAHLMNDFVSTTSIAIGINVWFAPQISEHCP